MKQKLVELKTENISVAERASLVAEIPLEWRQAFLPFATPLVASPVPTNGTPFFPALLNSSRPAWAFHEFRSKALNAELHPNVFFFLGEAPKPALRVQAVHGSKIVVINASVPYKVISPPAADGFLIYGSAEFVGSVGPCAIATADCLAVAAFTQVGGFVACGLVHAGWKGFAAGMLQNLIDEISRAAVECGLPPEKALQHTQILISPAIFGKSYECGIEVEDALLAHMSQRVENAPYASALGVEISKIYKACLRIETGGIGTWPNEGVKGEKDVKSEKDANVRMGAVAMNVAKCFPDLQLLGAVDLRALGVPAENISIVRVNTYDHAVLPSYRGFCHGKKALNERMYSVVTLP